MSAAPLLAREEFRPGPKFDARLCMNCGTCTALCPLGLELVPRRLFRDLLLEGSAAAVAHTEPVFSCLLCRLCEVNCPAGVHIAENIRTVRTYLNEAVHGLAEV